MTNNALQAAQQRADRNRQRQIGKALTRLYSDLAAEPAPDDLLRLLAEADSRQKPSQTQKK